MIDRHQKVKTVLEHCARRRRKVKTVLRHYDRPIQKEGKDSTETL